MTFMRAKDTARELSDNCGHPLDMWRVLHRSGRGARVALRALAQGFLGTAVLIAAILYTYATSGGNW